MGSKHDARESHQTTRRESKGEEKIREELQKRESSFKNGNKYICIYNYLKCKCPKVSN